MEILEFSLPLEWRQKFDFDGYIPTDGNLGLLIQHGEAIEKNLEHKPHEKKEKQSQGKKAVKFAKAESKKELDAVPYTCIFHGKNKTHNTENCYTLNNKAKGSTQTKTAKKTFTKKD